MPVLVPRGPTVADDEGLRAIADGLERYLADHPGATAEVYRRGKYLVRGRVIDPRFEDMSETQRHKTVWTYLDDLPDEIAGDLTFLVAITPEERDTGPSREFDHPTPVNGSLRLFVTGGAPHRSAPEPN